MQGEPTNHQLTAEQLRQVQLEHIWVEEKKVPKWLRGTWQAKLSFKQLEKGLTESEKEYLKRKRDTE
jgi:23S rRNA maturation mini-RNase III